MRNAFIVLTGALVLGGCARGEAVRTSANTMIIQTGAAPVCGGQGALHVAQQLAAIETIRAGYDRYIITGGQAQNNVVVSHLPGSYNTTATYGGGFYQGTTTYRPGPTIVAGSHDQGLAVVMFREGDAGAQQAVSARAVLGPDWPVKVKNGVHTCFLTRKAVRFRGARPSHRCPGRPRGRKPRQVPGRDRGPARHCG